MGKNHIPQLNIIIIIIIIINSIVVIHALSSDISALFAVSWLIFDTHISHMRQRQKMLEPHVLQVRQALVRQWSESELKAKLTEPSFLKFVEAQSLDGAGRFPLHSLSSDPTMASGWRSVSLSAIKDRIISKIARYMMEYARVGSPFDFGCAFVYMICLQSSE